ncbi:MAG: hypothetical protein WD749_12830 [Phycisphaerales bacterium]
MRTRAGLIALAAAALLAAGCESSVTQENYDRVNLGMSLLEVQSVLGEGEQDTTGGFTIGAGGTMGSSSSTTSRRQGYTWKEGDRQILVEFMDGKVVTKRKIGF